MAGKRFDEQTKARAVRPVREHAEDYDSELRRGLAGVWHWVAPLLGRFYACGHARWVSSRYSRLAPSMNSIGLFRANSNDAGPYPLVVTRIPFEAPSFCSVPNRSRTAETPTVFLYRLA
jgi:hypothetical protein